MSPLDVVIRAATERPHIARARWTSNRHLTPRKFEQLAGLIVWWAEMGEPERTLYRRSYALALVDHDRIER